VDCQNFVDFHDLHGIREACSGSANA